MDVTDIEDLIPEEFAGACGIAAPFIAYIFIGIAILINSWFTWADHALSDLGATGVSYNNVFNFGVMVAGMAGVIFAMGIFRYSEGKAGAAGTLLFLLGMICLILVGIFPMGNSPHYYVSILFFALSIIGMVLIGIDQLWDIAEPIWGVFILSVVGLTLINVALLYYAVPYELGPAIPEFVATIPMMMFSLVWGARLLFD